MLISLKCFAAFLQIRAAIERPDKDLSTLYTELETVNVKEEMIIMIDDLSFCDLGIVKLAKRIVGLIIRLNSGK
jgi:hypothetical protein